MDNWAGQNNPSWKNDLDSNGRNGSVHKHFYDKVEELLSISVYYLSCALKWVYDEAEEETKKKGIEDLNPNYWAEHPVPPPDKKPGTKPNEKPTSKDGLSSMDKFTEDTAKNAAKNAPKLLASGGVGLVGHKIIKNLKKSKRRR